MHPALLKGGRRMSTEEQTFQVQKRNVRRRKKRKKTIPWRNYSLPQLIQGSNITVKLQVGRDQFRVECGSCNQRSFVPFQNKKWINDGILECPKCGNTSVDLFAASK